MYFLVSVDVKFIGQRIVITLGKSDFCYFLTESSKEISVRLRQETIFANSLFVWSIYRSSICLSFSLSKKALIVRKTLNKGRISVCYKRGTLFREDRTLGCCATCILYTVQFPECPAAAAWPSFRGTELAGSSSQTVKYRINNC